MVDALKTAVLTGIGAVALTKKKVEEVIGDLVKGGELSNEQGQRIVEHLLAAGRQEQEHISEGVTRAVMAVVDKIGVARKAELDELAKRLERLEEKRDDNPSDV